MSLATSAPVHSRVRSDGSQVAPGFTIVSTGSADARQALWRCAAITRIFNGELRRCTVTRRKDRTASHTASGKHVYDVSQDEDPGFPDYLRQLRTEPAPHDIYQMVIHATAEIAGKLDIPVNVVITQLFHDYVADLMEYGIKLSAIEPPINIREALPIVGHQRKSEELRDCGRIVFSQRLRM
jgi:hypothetical protein